MTSSEAARLEMVAVAWQMPPQFSGPHGGVTCWKRVELPRKYAYWHVRDGQACPIVDGVLLRREVWDWDNDGVLLSEDGHVEWLAEQRRIMGLPPR